MFNLRRECVDIEESRPKVVLAEGALALLALAEPLADALSVEFVLACATREMRETASGGVDDVVADHALLNPFEALREIPLPLQDRVQNVSVLVVEDL